MYAIATIFGVPMLISGAMISQEGLRLGGLINYTVIMLILMLFAGGWQLLATHSSCRPAGRTRLGAVFSAWVGGTLLGVAVIFWISSLLSYDPTGSRVDWSRTC